MTASRKKTKKKPSNSAKSTRPVTSAASSNLPAEEVAAPVIKSTFISKTDAKASQAKKKPTVVDASAEHTPGDSTQPTATAPQKSDLAQAKVWHKWLALLMGAQALAIAILSVNRAQPVTTHFLAKDTLGSQVAGHPVFAVATRQLFTVNIRYVVALFLAVSAVMFGLAAWHKRYNQAGARAKLQWRWIGQGVSGTIALVAIALLAGVYDAATLAMLAGLSLVMPALAIFASRQDAPNVQRPLAWIGLTAGALPWAALALYIFGANLYNGQVAGYVYGIFASMLACFALLATLNFLQQRTTGRWANSWNGARAYTAVLVVAQTALAWQIFAGTLHP